MLAPGEFSVAYVASATGMALVLRRNEREASFLVSDASGAPIAIFLDGDLQFACMPCADNTSWAGVLIPNVTIEIDETSVLPPERGQPAGSLLRTHSQLLIMAKPEPRGRAVPVIILTGLTDCHEGLSAVFGRWQIVLGEGANKRVLKPIDVSEGPR